MKYWLFLLVLPFFTPKSERSAWEINYLVTTTPVSMDIELTNVLSYTDSTVVNITSTDSIFRYHYTPGETDVDRMYILTAKEETMLDTETLEPLINTAQKEVLYTVDWDIILEETGNSREILGFQCLEYQGRTIVGSIGQEVESFGRFWIFKLNEQERSLPAQYYLKEGLVLAKESTSTILQTGNELRYSMIATAVRQLNKEESD